EAFKLYDTFGFPLDLTEVMARERGLAVDTKTYNEKMEEQRSRSRENAKFIATELKLETISEGENSCFVGYQTLEAEAKIRLAKVESEKIIFVTDVTPFYAESGGQTGDKGKFITENGEFEIFDTQKQGDLILHFGKPDKNFDTKTTSGKLVVDAQKRKETAQNHTATHLLHAALRKILGTHVQQKGSLVCSDYLRFDFTHFEKIQTETLKEIEKLVNFEIQKATNLQVSEMPFDEAKKTGAMALFGEKYGEVVRVVKAGDFSTELCGGTHLLSTGEIGFFRLLNESSIASGVRRIEAVSGMKAVEFSQKESAVLDFVKKTLSANEDVETKFLQVFEDKKAVEKELANAKKELAKSGIETLLRDAFELKGFRVLAKEVSSNSVDELRTLAEALREKLTSGIGVLGAKLGGKASFVVVVTDDLVGKGFKAGEIVREIAKIADGNGGGKPNLAMAGGNENKLSEALESVRKILE
ncbi:alanine--tRNA ligase, partial [bacterium]|nr:alanine--tRNA ligase [bacterium]